MAELVAISCGKLARWPDQAFLLFVVVNQMMGSITVLRELLADESLWLDSAAVGKRLDASSIDPKAAASQARRAGRIFAAWDGHHFHYPAFQFERDGGPCAELSELIEALPRERDGTVGLDAVLWVFAPDLAFDGKSPAELFAAQPERIIKEARARRDGNPDRD